MDEETYQALLKQFELLRIECNTPEKALAYLVKLGTHNPDGSLTEVYGGSYTYKKD